MDTFLPFRDHQAGASITPVFFPEKPETPPKAGIPWAKFSKGPDFRLFSILFGADENEADL